MQNNKDIQHKKAKLAKFIIDSESQMIGFVSRLCRIFARIRIQKSDLSSHFRHNKQVDEKKII